MVGAIANPFIVAEQEVFVDPGEAHIRAMLAAALIVRGAVEVPSIPSAGQPVPDAAGLRLRELTDYVYRLITIEDLYDSDQTGRQR